MDIKSEPILWIILALFGKEVVSYFISKSKDNSKELRSNTEALIGLKSEVKYLKDAISEIQSLRKDVNNLGQKFRDMKN